MSIIDPHSVSNASKHAAATPLVVTAEVEEEPLPAKPVNKQPGDSRHTLEHASSGNLRPSFVIQPSSARNSFVSDKSDVC
jgi:hypothetical protein